MTHGEYQKSCLMSVGTACQDIKGAADFAAYAFNHLHEEEGQARIKHLDDCMLRLRGALSSLRYANEQVAEHGADGIAG